MLATLLDHSAGPALPLDADLRARYGGPLRFPAPPGGTHVFANFVSTLDGVVSFARPGQAQARLISRGQSDDRFLLALLRASADAVVVGAGTLRAEGDDLWSPGHVFPDAAPSFAALRAATGRPPQPVLVFITASGDLDLGRRVFGTGDRILVLTTAVGASRLRHAPGHVSVRAIGVGALSARAILDATAAETHATLVLTEGGPRLLGTFVRERLLDELFLTVAPQLAGRDDRERRLALVEGAAFAPDEATWSGLRSVKAAGDYLFLRYALGAAAASSAS